MVMKTANNNGAGRVAGTGFGPDSTRFESARLHFQAEGTMAKNAQAATTHEDFIHAVRRIVAPRVADEAARARLLAAKLVYGGGQNGIRGLCYYGAWSNGDAQDFIEVAAISQESLVQIAGTTIHELGHCLAGHGHGHGAGWKAACKVLGLLKVEAAGQSYAPENFDPMVWEAIEALPKPEEGAPSFKSGAAAGVFRLPRARKACPLGVGTRGGRSRGKGSGSRMRLYHCSCPEGTPGRKIRSATDELDVTCNRCGSKYELQASKGADSAAA